VSFDGNNQVAAGVQPHEGLVAAAFLLCDPAKAIPQSDDLISDKVDGLIAQLLTSAASLKLAENVKNAIIESPDEDTQSGEHTDGQESGKKGGSDTATSTSDAPDIQAYSKASRDLVAIMILPSGQAQPQERFFAGDTLLGILPHLPSTELTSLTRTVARLDLVSEQLRTFLVTHSDDDISCRMLKESHYISDGDLLKMVPTANEKQLRLIARRRLLNVVVCDAIIESENTAAILDLLRNAECHLSNSSYLKLMKIVSGNNDLETALCNRADLPQAIGLQLFWQVDRNLRRYLVSRFLTESSSLGKVMSIGMKSTAIPQFAGNASTEDIEALVSQIEKGDAKAAATLSRCCRIAPETAERIVNDAGGEPITVAFKCLAQSRLVMAQALKRWLDSSKCPIKGENRLVELHAQFDAMSFNKARMLLAYWDWAAREAGPFYD